ncbi:hypothetical protein ACP6PL_24360 [Dapis sp. BLCC M126]|uniref:hypothetical protein n=1 Tax=Dapis sp. BLCC M126 TaxID=3400189 RepID=UPI003CF66211
MYNIWKKNDPSEWPLPELVNKQGIEKYEYSLFSQNGEDGIIRYLFSEIGFGSKLFLEFGFGVTQSNSLRLILKEGFGGVFIDGNELSVKYFKQVAKLFGITNVVAISKFLNLNNLETTITQSGLPEEIDLLSIDVDGNDYWFWEAIKFLSPRIVIIEYNASLGQELSLSTLYDPNFNRHEKHSSGFYCGASIKAFEILGKEKGYSLIGCDSNGVNAFFVRDDCLTENIQVISSQLAYRPHKNRLERGLSSEEQFTIIKDLQFVNIQ